MSNIHLNQGSIYTYTYRDGTSVSFKFDCTRPTMKGEAVYGYVYACTSSRFTVDPGFWQRIILLANVIPASLVEVTGRHATPRARPVRCAGSHEPVNVGFHTLRMVCRVCDVDLDSETGKEISNYASIH